MPRKDVSVRHAVLRQRVQQRACHVVLAGHIGKPLRTILPGQNLIPHPNSLPAVTQKKRACLRGIVSFQGHRTTEPASNAISAFPTTPATEALVLGWFRFPDGAQ